MKLKTKWREQRDQFFIRRFNELFNEWKSKDKKNTQGEFARQICDIRKQKTGEKCPVTNRYVSEWKKGKWFPDQYISEIAEVLGVKEEEFYFHTHEDLYKFSSEYMTKLGHGEISQFCDEIGLDLNFLYVVRSLMGSDFDKTFPTWTPIWKDQNPFAEKPYTRLDRSVWSESAEMDEDVRFLQYEIDFEEDGEKKKKLIPLTRPDLRFLKDVQTEVVDYIQFLMMKRAKDMIREADEASRCSQKEDKTGIAFRPLSPEELCQIDKYADRVVDLKEGK